jgi:hypothetical protein
LVAAVDPHLPVQALTAAAVVVRPEMVPVQHIQTALVAVAPSPEVVQQLQQLLSAQLRQQPDVHNMVDPEPDILRQIMKAVVVAVAVYSVVVAATAMLQTPMAAVVVALDS